MDIGPTNKIYETPRIKKDENSNLPDRKKQKKQKRDQEQEKGERKIDIKI